MAVSVSNAKVMVGDADAVFLLESGATLQNVIIGKNQQEGVHCLGPCTLRFVWFEDVCEDAITVVRYITSYRFHCTRTRVRLRPCRKVTRLASTRGSSAEAPTMPQTRLCNTTAAAPSTLSTFTRRTTARSTAHAETAAASASATSTSRASRPVMVARSLASTSTTAIPRRLGTCALMPTTLVSFIMGVLAAASRPRPATVQAKGHRMSRIMSAERLRSFVTN
jgi:hypothetical protein